MVAQVVRPSAWIIVNDGSSDETAGIIDAASVSHPWIKAVHRHDRGFRKSGGGVIEAFYDGYSQAPELAWEFIAKLDGDLVFGPGFFQGCFQRFAADSKLGIGGGVVCRDANGKWIEEVKGDPLFHVRGATKIYQRACWDALGGLLSAPGWDTLDEIKANMLGWRTYTFRDIQLLQLKSTGTADGTWRNWVKNGRANYITGYHPLFMLAKCVSRLRDRPHGIVSAGLLFGFLSSYFQNVPRVPDEALIRYLRKQQLNRLLGKESLWT
jgi:glycosyltransferase involved in cell wall biosynthesis